MNTKYDTDHLETILKSTPIKHFDQYLRDKDIYPEYSLSSYFNDYMASHHLTPSFIIKNSRLAKEYAYQILNGRKKHPSRDKVLSLCIGAGMTFKEIQRALKINRQGVLYARDGRDAAITICIHHHIYDVDQINDFLFDRGFEPLS